MSSQWVTISVWAKPWRANASARAGPTRSASGRADLRGLFTEQGSARSETMTLAGQAVRRKRAVADHEGPRSSDLFAWYDRHRRKLPWRAPPGERPDPYRVWL